MNHQQKSEHDELRARFTAWLETTVYRARLKYLEREKPKVNIVSIEELPESALAVSEKAAYYANPKSAFDFEEERLAEAFAKLPIKRQEILTMLFVEEKTGGNCTDIELFSAACLRPALSGIEEAAHSIDKGR